jgi:hypothetical protein
MSADTFPVQCLKCGTPFHARTRGNDVEIMEPFTGAAHTSCVICGSATFHILPDGTHPDELPDTYEAEYKLAAALSALLEAEQLLAAFIDANSPVVQDLAVMTVVHAHTRLRAGLQMLASGNDDLQEELFHDASV